MSLRIKKSASNENLQINLKTLGIGNGTQDIITFINEVIVNMTSNSPKSSPKKALMVMGLTGTGKSTLINYLNDVKLNGIRKKGVWRVTPANESLQGSFEIGHGSKSKTIYPEMYTPPDADFSYIDNPGFSDNRGFEIEIANGFFRKEITKNFENLKFLLLITHNDLLDRAISTRQAIKIFSEFIDIHKNQHLISLRKAIGIIFTKVDNYDEETIRKDLKELFINILHDEKNAGKINNVQEEFFTQIVNNNQFEIFSSPKEDGKLLSDRESRNIKGMIKKMEYISKEKAKINLRVSDEYYSRLINYVKNSYNSFIQNFNKQLNKAIIKYYNDQLDIITLRKYIKTLKVLHQLKAYCENEIQFNEFIKLINNHQIITSSDEKQLISNKEIIDYFIELLPNNERNSWPDKRKWAYIESRNQIDEFLKNLKKLIESNLSDEFNKLKNRIEFVINENIDLYFFRSSDKFESIESVRKVAKLFENFGNMLSKFENLNIFLDLIDENFLNKNLKYQFSKEYEKLNEQIDEVSNFLELERIHRLKNKFNRLNKTLLTNTEGFLKQLNNLVENIPIFTYENETFTYTGHFVNLSSVLNVINHNSDIFDLKSVQVFASYIINLDTDFIPNKRLYKFDSPDLILISKLILVGKPTKIDLSCLHKPNYPDNEKKARNGNYPGENGKDGKHGLPGCNGGNMLILTDNFINSQYLIFVSSNGIGGPGQNGGDGAKGIKGVSALISDVPNNGYFKSYEKERYSLIGSMWNTKSDSTYHYHVKYCLSGNIGGFGGNSGKKGKRGLNGSPGSYLKLLIKEEKISETKGIESENFGEDGYEGKPGYGGDYGETACMIRFFETSKNLEISDIEDSKNYDVSGNAGDTFNCRLRIRWYCENRWSNEFMESDETLNFESSNSRKGKIMNSFSEYVQERPKYNNGINVFKQETEYLKSMFKLNKFMFLPFNKHVIEENFYVPNLDDLIERVIFIINSQSNQNLYTSLKNESLSLYKKTNNSQERKVISYIISTLTSFICKEKSLEKTGTGIVMNISNLLSSTLNFIKNFKKLNEMEIRNTYKSIYVKNLAKKIKESNEIIEKLRNDIEYEFIQIDEDIKKLLKEISELKQKSHNVDRSLLKNYNQLKIEISDKIKIQKIFGTLKIGCSILTLINPMCALAGTIGYSVLEGTNQIINNDKYLSASINMAEMALKRYKVYINQTKNVLEASPTLTEKKSKIDKGIDLIESSKQIVNDIQDLAFDKANSDSELNEIENAIRSNHQFFKTLHQNEQQIYNLHSGLIFDVKNELNKFSINLDESASSLVFFEKLKFKKRLEELTNVINEIMKINFNDNQKTIQNRINRIKFTVDTMLQIFVQIETFMQQVDLASYIEQMTRNDYSIPAKYIDKISELERIIKSNIIIERYYNTIETFEYWSYPYFNEYTEDIHELGIENIKNKKTLDDETVALYSSNIEKIIDKLNQEETFLIAKHNSIQYKSFTKFDPFYKWSFQYYETEMKQLLNGENATLYADVKYTKFNALKFSTIYLSIEVDSPEANKTLNEILKNFHVELKHSGLSYYLLNDEYYSIDSNSKLDDRLLLRYKYRCHELRSESCHSDSNESFKKLVKNKPILSPYTFWDIRIISENKNRLYDEIDSIFQKDKNTKIYITMFGDGQYIFKD